MNQETLDIIGRRHTVEQTKEAFHLARELGYDNINMDLIVGLPGEDIHMVERTLEQVRELAPDSITVHSLAVKRAARLNIFKEKYQEMSFENNQEIMDLTMKTAYEMGMGPYYLYRQKNMKGNFENVGYAKVDKAGIYNILIMEEKQTILAAGAGAGLAAAFAAPLASSLIVIESIERFDAPKTAITTLLAGVVAGAVASMVFPVNPYHLIEVTEPVFAFFVQVKYFLILAVIVSVCGKFYSSTMNAFRHVYAKVNSPAYVKMLYLVLVAYIISLMQVNLTGGGEQFLLAQAQNGSTQIMWVTAVMLLHFVFSVFSVSSGLPGGSFIPTLVTGGLLGQIVGLVGVRYGVIGQENVSYIMLVSMSAFLVAVVRTPLTAIVLITEITGHFEVFYPSVVVGGLTYYFTELLQMKPSNVSLYEDMIHAPDFKEEKRYTLSVEIMTDSYLDGKLVDELSLPERCVIINVHRDGKNLVPAGTRLIPGDQVQIEMDSQDIEKLYEPLVSMANIY